MKTKFNRQAKLFLFATVLYGIAFSFWELFFNIYIITEGFPKDSLGLIRTSVSVAALVFGLFLGKLADRIGHRSAMLIGLSVGLMGMFAQVIFKQLWVIILMGFIQGAGMMLYRVAVPALISANSKDHSRTLLFSLNFSLMTFAGVIGNLLAGQLPSLASRLFSFQPASAAAYQAVILAGVLLGATALIPIFMLKNSPEADNGKPFLSEPKLGFRALFKQKVIFQLFIINTLVGLGASLLIPYLNIFFREEHHMTDQNLGYLFSLSSLLVVIGSLSAPAIARILKSKIKATNITQGISIFFLLLTGFSPVLWLAQIGFLFRTVFMQLSSPLLENFAMDVSPSGQQSTISSIRGVGWQLGQSLGLYISGLVQVSYGFTPLFITTAILYLVSIFLTWINFRPMEKKLEAAKG